MKTEPLLGLAGLLALAAPIAAQQAPAAPPAMDRYVQAVMRRFEVPGVALAIVKDGQMVLTRGYGVRTLGESALVDEHTLFGIASNTKAFTATALGLLVEDGLLEWDAPVIRYLPWFRMSDPYVTAELTIRDLLVHRSGLGLGAGDLLWWPASTYGRREIVRRLQYIPLATSFRSAYAYDNVLYGVAGEVIAAVSGVSWEDFVQTRILDRVGMADAHPRYPPHSDNIATTHARVDGTVRPIAPLVSDNVNPPGGIHASVTDMARWMIVQLDSGRLASGARLFRPVTTRQLWTLVTPIPFGDPAPELAPLRRSFNGYALGFGIRDYRGVKMVTHTGGLPGYVSRVAMLPDQRLGVAVLTNQEAGAAFDAIVHRVLDHYLDAQYDWLGAYSTLQARSDSALAARDAGTAAARNTASRPSLPLERYAADYEDAWYGDIGISYENGGLVMRFRHTPQLEGDLSHWQYDTFLVRWRDRELRADAFVTFALNTDGTIREARMVPASPSVDFSFDFQDLRLVPRR